jgi:hypothetical protein
MPQFPLYIPSKGRHEYNITSKALTKMGVPHFVVVEPQEVEVYSQALRGSKATVLPLGMSYKEKYELCDGLGLNKSTGPGPARNFAWDHSKDAGYSCHWVMDDNINGFFRLNRNLKVPCNSPNYWTAMEDFCLRYENVAMAGPNYFMFAPRKTKQKPFACNTRIYSCNMIRNDVPFRWRGRYNEDTILSLDMLKAGWCTVQFNAFLQYKMSTQAMKGGNTAEFYHAEGLVKQGEKYADTGTLAKSHMQVRVHPDVSKIVYRFGRIHHLVDYSQFKANMLRRKQGVKVNAGVNNYGMTLRVKESGENIPAIKANAA